jgi:hypothetical protein
MRTTVYQSMAAAAACLGMLASPVAMAAPQGQGGFAADVALAEGGVLTGQVVDAQGAVQAGTPVVIFAGGREVARVATNRNGVFSAPGLKGGVYEVAAAGHRGVYRAWAPRTAPPSANRAILAVAQQDSVRGQYAPPLAPAPPGQPGLFGKTMNWISDHPIITAGIVATAIAVPVALSDDDDPAS